MAARGSALFPPGVTRNVSPLIDKHSTRKSKYLYDAICFGAHEASISSSARITWELYHGKEVCQFEK